MPKKHTLTRGRQAFLDYYTKLLPQFDTPEKLNAYLTTKNPQVILVSPIHESQISGLWHKSGLDWSPLPWFPHTLVWPKNVLPGTSLPGFREGWLYPLNPSSLLPVLAMQPQPGQSILDAAAAPGGKTLAILNFLYPKPVSLIANDVSLPRFKRLRTVLKRFGFPEVVTARHPIQALPHILTAGSFDKILLDAPCSSEKHVYNSKRHLKIWSENRITTLAHLQKLLVDSLLPLLKPGGTLVYSTCALAPQENEGVVEYTLSRHPELKFSPCHYPPPTTHPPIPTPCLSLHSKSLILRLSSSCQHQSPHFLYPALFQRPGTFIHRRPGCPHIIHEHYVCGN